MDAKMKIAFAEKLLTRAEEKLKAARLLYENNYNEDSISRCYYAVFLAAKAILTLLGYEPDDRETDESIRELFSLNVVSSGLMDPEYGRILSDLCWMGKLCDRSVYTFYSREDARKALEDCKSFLEKAREIIYNLIEDIEQKYVPDKK